MILSITDAFDEHQIFMDLLGRVNITRICDARLMNEEGIESTRHLSTITIKILTSTIENVNILFGGKIENRRIYFPPIKVEFLKALKVYLQRYITKN